MQEPVLILLYSIEFEFVKFKTLINTMKTTVKSVEIIFSVIANLAMALNKIFSSGMHETSTQFSEQTVYRAIPVYPGNPLLEFLKRKKNNPLPFPSI